MKVYLDTIGCRLNQAEIEIMAHQFRQAGHEIVALAEDADLAVVNTCAVTGEAASDSRSKIRLAARTGAAEIVVTGCWATIEPQKARELPNVTRVFTNTHKNSLVDELLRSKDGGGDRHAFDLEPIQRVLLPGLHRRTRAFIKVQDGCDNHCTFCITTIARGVGRSRPLREVIADIQGALAGGTKEIVLTGVHLGSWGQDQTAAGKDDGRHLRDLVAVILRETDVPRLRLSSLEPWDLNEDFFSLWENPRLMPHLHLPLQSGCEATLRRMARKTTPDSFRALVAAARKRMPQAAITTDIITGFPGETEAEFAESLAFIREMDFAGGHVFTYSPRPGTGAERLGGQVKPQVRKERNHILQEVFEESSGKYRNFFTGRTLQVLWESASELGTHGWQMEGLTGNYLRVRAASPAPRWNELDEVLLAGEARNSLVGIIQN